MFEGETSERYGTKQLLARIKRTRHSTHTRSPRLNIISLSDEAEILQQAPKRGFNCLKTHKKPAEYLVRR